MMRRGRRTALVAAAVLLYLAVAGGRITEGQAQSAAPAPASATAQTTGAVPAASQAGLVNQYCIGCHSERGKAGGLVLQGVALDDGQHAEIAEKVIRKLRGGLMPPAGQRRPDKQSVATFVSSLETAVDAVSVQAEPGRVPLRRLNRREYANAVRDLLGLDIDAKKLLPDDNVKGHFDNNAAALQVSPNFIDQYIFAARDIAVEAIGNPKALAETTTYGDVAAMVISLPPAGAPGT